MRNLQIFVMLVHFVSDWEVAKMEGGSFRLGPRHWMNLAIILDLGKRIEFLSKCLDIQQTPRSKMNWTEAIQGSSLFLLARLVQT